MEAEEPESETDFQADEVEECAVDKYVMGFFAEALDKVKYIKQSCGKVPLLTQAATEKAVKLLEKTLRRISTDLEPKFAKLGEMDELLQEKEALKRQNAALERAHAALVQKLEDMHTNAGTDQVTISFPQQEAAGGVNTISCNRKLLSRWSPAMEALMHHGNGLEGGSPTHLSINDSSIETFNAAMAFETSGKLPDGFVLPLNSATKNHMDKMVPSMAQQGRPTQPQPSVEPEMVHLPVIKTADDIADVSQDRKTEMDEPPKEASEEEMDEGEEKKEGGEDKEEEGADAMEANKEEGPKAMQVMDEKKEEESKVGAEMQEQKAMELDTAKVLSEVQHPLLRLADLYDLENLQAEYFHMMLQREPLNADTAAQYLELASRYNARTMSNQAAALISMHINPFTNSMTESEFDKVFLTLSAAAVASVLAQDNLRCARESAIIDFVRNWASHDPQRADQVGLTLRSIRLELCSFKELADMPDLLKAEIFTHAKADFSKAIQGAVMEKLTAFDAGNPCNQRKRKFTKLSAEEDDSYVKVARFMQTVQGGVGVLGA